MRIRTLVCARGFTLAELLIAIAVVLAVTLIAIPNLPGTRIAANENSAIASLRDVYQAEIRYDSTYPTVGFSCSLVQLGGHAREGSSSPAGARMLGNDLADGEKSGYRFAVSHCTRTGSKTGGKNGEQATAFEVTALPQYLGKSGHRGFCIDQGGEIKADPAGGSNCTQSIQ